jgi:hypothetical protein
MDIIINFLSIQQYIRIYHWTTPIYNKDVVSGQLYEKLDSLIDKFVETFLGKNKLTFEPFKITVSSNTDIISSLNSFKRFLLTDLELALNSKSAMKNTDLKNIRDEMLGDVNQFIFLLKLK